MFDGRWRGAVDKRTAPVGAWLQAHGITADVLTATGLVSATATAVAVPATAAARIPAIAPGCTPTSPGRAPPADDEFASGASGGGSCGICTTGVPSITSAAAPPAARSRSSRICTFSTERPDWAKPEIIAPPSAADCSICDAEVTADAASVSVRLTVTCCAPETV